MPGYRIHQVAAPFNASEVFELDHEQTADVIYFAHRNHRPQKLIRAGHYDWSFGTVAFTPLIEPPTGVGAAATNPNTDAANSGNAYFPQPASYVVTAYNEETGQESRASSAASATNDLSLKRNYNTVTWAAATGATFYRIYKAENGGTYGYIGMTEALTFRDDNIGPDLSEGPPVGDDPFVSANDRPGSVTFHEQRSVWGGTINKPNAVFFSRSADLENMDFTRPARADDGFAIGINATKVNVVNQMVSHTEGLLVLTSNNIFLVKGANDDYIAASPPPKAPPVLNRGVSRLNPICIDNIVFYETSKRSSVRTAGYKFEDNGVSTDEISIFSNHLFEGRYIKDWAYLEKPASIILAVLDDGTVACLTFEKEQSVIGWTLWETDGRVESICAVTEQSEDRAYFVVVREVGGVEVRFIERLASELWTSQEEACYLDCARTFENEEPTNTVDRMDHLEGREVVALVDGSVVRGLTVTNGTVTLPVPGRLITIGLPFTAEIRTLPLAIQTGQGWNIARTQQVSKVIIRTVNTRGLEAGPNEANMFPVKEREAEAYDEPTDLTTGDYETDLSGTSQTEAVVTIRSSDPLPMHITAVLPELAITDG